MTTDTIKLIDLVGEVIILDVTWNGIGHVSAASGRVRHCGGPGDPGEALWVANVALPVDAEVRVRQEASGVEYTYHV